MCALTLIPFQSLLLELSDLSFSYPQASRAQTDSNTPESLAFPWVNTKIYQGEFVLVCGVSGSGKTTFLRTLNPLLTLNGTVHGTIRFQDRAIQDLHASELASQIAFVQQHSSEQLIFSDIQHELSFALENLGYDHSFIVRRVAEIAQYFGITHWLSRKTGDLSGGEQQIVNLAAALTCHPKLLILDEPTAQLDEVSKARLLALLKRINSELDLTIIIAEHDLEAVLPLADSVIYLKDESAALAMSREAFAFSVLEDQSSPLYQSVPVACRALYNARHALIGDEYSYSPYISMLPFSISAAREELRSLFVDWKLRSPGSPAQALITPLISSAGATHPQQEKHNEVMMSPQAEPTPLCSCKRLALCYDRTKPCIFDDLTWELHKDEIHMLIGGNGSGKSTLLKAVAGIMKPAAGRIQWHQSCSQAFVPQEVRTMFCAATVSDEIASYIPPQQRKDSQAVIERILTAARLEHRRFSHPYDLSAGEMQRLGVELAMMNQPNLLLLDEPCKGLDIMHKQEMYDRIKELNRQGTTILIATHDLDMVAQLGDRVTLLTPHMEPTTDTVHHHLTTSSYYTTPCVRLTQGLFPKLPTCITFDEFAPHIDALSGELLSRAKLSRCSDQENAQRSDADRSLNKTMDNQDNLNGLSS